MSQSSFLYSAFRQDFEKNGPSLFRICETLFNGWKRYHNHPEPRVRTRFAHEAHKLRATYNAALWAMEMRLKRSNPEVGVRIRALRCEIESAFGLPTWLLRLLLGPVLVWTSKREDRRLANRVTYEPQTFVEHHNWAEKSQTGEASNLVATAQRGFKPTLESIAARVGLPEEPSLTAIGD